MAAGIFDRIVYQTESFSFEEMLEHVRRDLENLLNAMQGIENLPSYYEHIPTSLATYGLHGFNSVNLESHTERSRLMQSIKKTIQRFEPRLTDVHIEDHGVIHPFILTFGITAILLADGREAPIQLGTTINKYGSAEIKR